MTEKCTLKQLMQCLVDIVDGKTEIFTSLAQEKICKSIFFVDWKKYTQHSILAHAPCM